MIIATSCTSASVCRRRRLLKGSVDRKRGCLSFEVRWHWQVYVRDCTMVTPYPLLLFGGEIVVKHELMTLCIDDWIEFRSPGKVAVLIKQLRAVRRPHTCTPRDRSL